MEKAFGFSSGKELEGLSSYKFRQLVPGSPARGCCEFSTAGNLKYQNWMFSSKTNGTVLRAAAATLCSLGYSSLQLCVTHFSWKSSFSTPQQLGFVCPWDRGRAGTPLKSSSCSHTLPEQLPRCACAPDVQHHCKPAAGCPHRAGTGDMTHVIS